MDAAIDICHASMSLQISDTFIYDPEEALFYSVGLPREVGSRMLTEGNMTSLADATASRNQSPFELDKSYNKSPLLCFTTGNTNLHHISIITDA